MSGKQSGAVDKAMRAYRNGATNVYKLAARFGVAHTTIYRAIKRDALRIKTFHGDKT